MFCRFCGAEINDNAVFCNTCGKCIRETKDNLNTHVTLTLGQEIKTSKVLCAMSFLCLVWTFVWDVLWRVISLYAGYEAYYNTYFPFFVQINWMVLGLYLGIFIYAITKKSIKFTLLFMIPYLLECVTRWWKSFAEGLVESTTEGVIRTPLIYDLLVYLPPILLPFIILGLLKVTRGLIKNIRSNGVAQIAYYIIAIMIYCLYAGIHSSWSSIDGIEVGWNLNLQTFLYCAGSILMSNMLMHVLYRKNVLNV